MNRYLNLFVKKFVRNFLIILGVCTGLVLLFWGGVAAIKALGHLLAPLMDQATTEFTVIIIVLLGLLALMVTIMETSSLAETDSQRAECFRGKK